MAQQAMAPLPPFNPPIGVFPNFCQPVPVTLKMKEKGLMSWLSKDDFSITDVNEREVCKCKGKMLSISGRKVFTDPQGRELFSLKNKLFRISKSFYAEAPDGRQLFEVKRSFSLLSSKTIVRFTDASTHQPMELEVGGNWVDRSAVFTFQGRPVGNVSRSFLNFGQPVSDHQSYFVNCAPGADLVLMAAICVSLDERENQKQKEEAEAELVMGV